MIEINLLPKEYSKGSASLSLSKAGKYAAAGVVAVLVLLVGITFYQMSQLSNLEDNIEKANRRAELLKDDIRMVDALTDVKTKITKRMRTVEKLDRHRSAWVRILEDLARNVPEFVWLDKFYEEGRDEAGRQAAARNQRNQQAQSDSTQVEQQPDSQRPMQVEGFAYSLNALAAFMIKMMRSDYFDEVELVEANEVSFDEEGRVVRTNIRSQDGQKAYNFRLTCTAHYLSDEELRNLIAGAGEEDQKSATSHKQLN